jgi:hypothetical protein
MDADVDQPDEPGSRPAAEPGSIAAQSASDVIARDDGETAPTLPSPLARAIGFVAILLAGAAGGFIGYAVTDLQRQRARERRTPPETRGRPRVR